MIPVTCYKLQGFSYSYTIWKNTNPLSDSYKRYGRIPIPYLNYIQQPIIV